MEEDFSKIARMFYYEIEKLKMSEADMASLDDYFSRNGINLKPVDYSKLKGELATKGFNFPHLEQILPSAEVKYASGKLDGSSMSLDLYIATSKMSEAFFAGTLQDTVDVKNIASFNYVCISGMVYVEGESRGRPYWNDWKIDRFNKSIEGKLK